MAKLKKLKAKPEFRLALTQKEVDQLEAVVKHVETGKLDKVYAALAQHRSGDSWRTINPQYIELNKD